MAVRVTEAKFQRLGYSGDDVYAEVGVRAEGWDAPLVAVFRLTGGRPENGERESGGKTAGREAAGGGTSGGGEGGARLSGGWELANVTEQRAEYALDWYDNDLHEAYPKAEEKLFGAGPGGGAARRAFAEQVLGMPSVREAIEDALFYRT